MSEDLSYSLVQCLYTAIAPRRHGVEAESEQQATSTAVGCRILFENSYSSLAATARWLHARVDARICPRVTELECLLGFTQRYLSL